MAISVFLSNFAYMLNEDTLNSPAYQEALFHAQRIMEIRKEKAREKRRHSYAWKLAKSNKYANTKEERNMCYKSIVSALEWGEKVNERN